MEISRRNFIKTAAKHLLGGIIVYGTFPSLVRSSFETQNVTKSLSIANFNERDWEKHYWGFVCNIDRCIGCGRCVVACKRENKVPWGPKYYRTWVERYVISMGGEIFADSPNGGRDGFKSDYLNLKYRNLKVMKSFFVPKLCNQCDNPPCVKVCPTGASYKTKDGVILVNKKICIGCKYCIVACPYEARFMLPEGVIDKCTYCYHRITKGFLPACVEVCPVGTRIFGDLRDLESQVQKIFREEKVSILKPSLGTHPKVYYMGLEKGVE
ncbi:MAG: 4Fe-4S dicluster domain-containing protein [Thermodesulfobacteriota bacterium]